LIEKFKEIYENRHAYAENWKRETGGKVMGYFCTYVPEEILYAADILPVRILGGHKPQSVTEPHLFGMYCPFCRDCLAQGLLGKYDYLDGLMIGLSCLHIRQSFHSWKLHRPTEFDYILPMPNALQSPASLSFLKGEYEKFKSALEEWIGRTITDDDLRRGIEIVDRDRKMMKQVYELRKSETPPITGAESLYMVVASQMSDKREHAKLVEQCLEKELPGRLKDRDAGVRLMVVGSEDDNFALLEMIEGGSATIVCDDHCTGTRYFWDEVQLDSAETDPLTAIARRYVERTPCPDKDWPERIRIERILDFVDDYGVSGVIIAQQKFCDPHECEKVHLRETLENKGIKTLALEFDVTDPIGPFRIRTDAFVETLSAGDDLF